MLQLCIVDRYPKATGVGLHSLIICYTVIYERKVMKNLLNSVRLVGNVGYDPEIREFEGGKKLARLSLATNERVTLLSGDVINNTQWHRLVAWGAVADRFEKMVKKGSKLMIEGRLQHRTYVDADGQKKEASEVVVKNILLIEAKGKSADMEVGELQPAGE